MAVPKGAKDSGVNGSIDNNRPRRPWDSKGVSVGGVISFFLFKLNNPDRQPSRAGDLAPSDSAFLSVSAFVGLMCYSVRVRSKGSFFEAPHKSLTFRARL